MGQQAKKQAKRRRNKRLVLIISAILIVALLGLQFGRVDMPVLEPAGPIAAGQRQLLITAFLLMLIVVVPVFGMVFAFAWRYRESNKKATYRPNWDRNPWAEAVWWLIPAALIAVLAVMTWQGTFKYDPHKPLAARSDTLTIQVVALDWRWLFIYPDQKIASINEVRFPVNKALQFDVTADAPMNSFWIPQLGGQIYAMPGMGTRLHLKADRTGSYYGSSANISGKGFADMNFQAMAVSDEAFNAWVHRAQKQPPLTMKTYSQLARQSSDTGVYTFGKPDNNLYDTIIGKYMGVDHSKHTPTEHTEYMKDHGGSH